METPTPKKRTTNSKDYNQAYYKANRERWINPITCDVCQKKICRASFSKHAQSKMHQKLINKQSNTNIDIEQLAKLVKEHLEKQSSF